MNLRKEKAAMEVELHANQRRVAQLQHEVTLVNRELDKFTRSFGKEIEEKLEQKDRDAQHLTFALQDANKDLEAKDGIISRLLQEKRKTKSLLLSLNEKLRQQEDQIISLQNLGYKEFELKKSALGSVNNKLAELAVDLKDGSIEEIQSTVELTRKLESLDKENEYLKLEVEELRRDLAMQAERRQSQKDISIVKAPHSQKQLFTQGTLLLDYNKMFGSE